MALGIQGKRRRLGSCLAVLGLILPGAAIAAEALEEITVTAEKRGENLQAVPISITAFSGAGLQARGILTTVDLAQFTPGLQFSTNAAYAQPYIRGIGSNQLNVASDPSVAVNIDGVYVTRPASQIANFLDVERVEVLKGPQGTLYGRNATGGAINIISNSPTREWTGKASVEIGNYDALNGSFVLSGPIVADKVLARVAVGRETRDGFYPNLVDDRRIDSLGVTQARGIVDVLATDTFSLRFAGSWRREKDTRGLAAFTFYPGPANLPPYNRPILSGNGKVDADGPLRGENEADSVSMTAKWQIGDLTATSITAHRHSSFAYALDLDQTGYHYADNLNQTETSRTTTQEVRLEQSDANRFYWTIGAFYLGEKASANNLYKYWYANLTIVPQGRAATDAYAAFGQAYFKLTDQIRLTAGARYSAEERTVDVRSTVNTAATTFKDKANFYAFTPKFAIDYTFAPNVMAYASATKGFKSGGYNATSTTNPAFRPEQVWAYEAGIKSDLMNRRLRLNAAMFYYDYTDLQVIESVPGFPSRITNAAAATIKGAEFSAEAAVTSQLILNANLALLDAKYDQYKTIDSERPSLGVLDLKGLTLPRSPKMTFNLGAAYSWDAPWGQFTARGDYFHTSKIYFVSFDTPKETQAGYGLVNASLTFTPNVGSWTATAWARNLTDQKYSQVLLSNSGFFGTIGFPGAPQTYGLRFDYRF
ncbi:MAG: hypothetical protein JWM77_3493 [Rhodospirillales bacterium]|nr:hypothetical protein [Rhodospirillales bacterium]